MMKSHIELMDSEEAISVVVNSKHKPGYQEKQNRKKHKAQRQLVRKNIVSANEDCDVVFKSNN
jgi:hypothetical protein